MCDSETLDIKIKMAYMLTKANARCPYVLPNRYNSGDLGRQTNLECL